MAEVLKDELNRGVVDLLAERITAVAPQRFAKDAFIDAVLAELEDLELKERVNLIADSIEANLDLDYPAAVEVLVEVADGDVGQWAAWPLCSFVERHGVSWPEESLTAMESLTKAWTCEFALRPYLDQHLERSRIHLERWAKSEDEHVRRLASEGTRPLLPWGKKVQALVDDPSIGIGLLDRLRDDESETVRRSVANHLNDVAKADPDLVVATLARWQASTRPLDAKHVRHALRTLVKQGHSGALQLLGFTTEASLAVEEFQCSPPTVELGGSVQLQATLTSTGESTQRLVVDFVIHHQTARGKTSPKVFKWKIIDLAPGETSTITKSRSIQNASTRTYHPGLHRVELQVAGRVVAASEFTLATE